MLRDPFFYATLLLITGYIILGGFVARFVWTVRSVRSVTRKKSRVVTDPTAFHYHTSGKTFRGKDCQYPDACTPFMSEQSSLRERLKAT